MRTQNAGRRRLTVGTSVTVRPTSRTQVPTSGGWSTVCGGDSTTLTNTSPPATLTAISSTLDPTPRPERPLAGLPPVWAIASPSLGRNRPVRVTVLPASQPGLETGSSSRNADWRRTAFGSRCGFSTRYSMSRSTGMAATVFNYHPAGWESGRECSTSPIRLGRHPKTLHLPPE